MMRALVALCVRHSGALTALTALALLLGSWGALHSPLDVFPEFVPTRVDVQTEAPGFAPQQVEELVTKPIENAVNGTAGLATLRSESIPGLSVVTITFAGNVDVHVAASQSSAARCPAASGRPSSRRWSRAPWMCSRSDCCPTKSMPTRCAMSRTG